MAKRSLEASPAGIQRAKRAFALKGWTQENLAGEINLKTRQPIWRFFTGQPVDRQVFMDLCQVLDLDWREIAENPPAEFLDPGESLELQPLTIDELVAEVRSQHHDTIQHQCGILQLLDIRHPVNIDDIYVDVNILEAVANQQFLEVSALNNLDPADFNRMGLGIIEQPQIPGVEAVKNYGKLRVLGKPGIGKTTFLQHLAVQCNQGDFAPEQVPIFIVLRAFAEAAKRQNDFSLFNYIYQTLVRSGLSDPTQLERLLVEGRVLVLMDGMDEVLNQDINTIIREIRGFSDKYHRNRFVVSCRTAAQKLALHGFTDVEIAPFSAAQITTFAQKWFVTLGKTATSPGQIQAAEFIEKLDLPENWQFRQLVVTPLFLHLSCWVFQGEGQLPTKRTAFYKQGLDLLLGKWDETKGVKRDDAYRGFLIPQKMRLLSQLAAVTFEQGQYFFEQRVIEQYIEDYLRNLSGVTLEPEELQLESEAMLKAIEAQHGLLIERARGVFSFSYLAFQEYLTARKIVATHNLRALEQALGGLVSHITDPHWHEVFLLTAAMLRSADSLVQLMKQEIDALVAQDPHLQDFLMWASQKSQSIPTEPKLATTRAFYLALAQDSPTADQFALASTLDQGIFLDAALEHLLREFVIDHSQDFAYAHACSEALNNILVIVLDAGFYKSLQQLKEQLPVSHQSQEQLQTWWQNNYANWVEQLKSSVAQYRNIHHPWQFSPEQEEVLKHYYDANQLLIDCLNSNCEVTETIRQEIEATLLLPQKELEDREWQGS
ncbi:NACHT domain-containing protein [Leptolyngbya sp. PCC 6406]|uniref:NACHT domain-containing protein n=1 Tax=Leptolyngbya sp. PCC 6406 TaxID=1173264 RepID=UPI0002ACFAF7|nr:NACHT domain-containing NTPase [Leptolyngbya sp. PCC 6406]